MKQLILLFLVMACSDSKFRKVEELRGFRVLGIIASDPEVVPPGSSTLQLIVSDTEGGGRQIIGTTESCIDPGIALGASVSCDHDPATVPGTYTIDTSFDADLGAADLYTGVASDLLPVNVPGTIFLGRSSREQFNGVGYITIFRFEVDGKKTTIFKRILATNRGVENQNPSISSILLNGVAIGASKLQKDDKLLVTTSVPETYNFINIDGSQELKTEEFAVSWYVSSGEFNKPKADVQEVVKYLDNTPASTMVVLSLLRDERGGMFVEKAVSAP